MKFVEGVLHTTPALGATGIMTLAMKLGLGSDENEARSADFGYKVMQGWTVMDRLDGSVPTLVTAGRYDFLFPPEHQAILADRIPDAGLELIECAGHNPQIEEKDVTVGIIRSFLAETTPVYA
jgi:proline iminopeptidase